MLIFSVGYYIQLLQNGTKIIVEEKKEAKRKARIKFRAKDGFTRLTKTKTNSSKNNTSSCKGDEHLLCKKCGKKVKYPAFSNGQFHVNYHKKCFSY